MRERTATGGVIGVLMTLAKYLMELQKKRTENETNE